MISKACGRAGERPRSRKTQLFCALAVDTTRVTHHEVEEGDDGEGGLYDALQKGAVGKDSPVDGEVHRIEVRLACGAGARGRGGG